MFVLTKRVAAVVAGIASAAVYTAGCRRQGWYRCHFRAVVETTDSRKGVPCVAQALKGDEPNRGLLLVESKTTTGSPVHGWLRVVRPVSSGTIPVHLVVSCSGYEDLARDFTWTSTPDTCKPGVEVGELRLHPGKAKVWPGSGPSRGQERIDPE